MSEISSVFLKLWNIATDTFDWFIANLTGTADEYEVNKTIIDLYNQSEWFANDTLNNERNITGEFPIIDVNPPLITLIDPSNNLEITSNWYNFTYNYIDSSEVVNCTINFDIKGNTTDSSLTNSTEYFEVYGLDSGIDYVWRIYCTDEVNNEGISEERTLKVRLPFSSSGSSSGEGAITNITKPTSIIPITKEDITNVTNSKPFTYVMLGLSGLILITAFDRKKKYKFSNAVFLVIPLMLLAFKQTNIVKSIGVFFKNVIVFFMEKFMVYFNKGVIYMGDNQISNKLRDMLPFGVSSLFISLVLVIVIIILVIGLIGKFKK